jgi:hypothetical protein
MTNYRDLTKATAAAALQGSLDERSPALERLRERLMADGQDPDALLDGTFESLVPLWRCSAALEFKEGQEAAGSAAKLGGEPMLARDV